jgi:hypothetical protein
MDDIQPEIRTSHRDAKKAAKWSFLLCAAIYIGTFFSINSLPDPAAVSNEIKNNAPQQAAVKMDAASLNVGNLKYSIHPLTSYDIYGLVVSEYDSGNFLDITHKKDPINVKDLCVVWGSNAQDGTYKKVSFSSGEFTCFFSWKTALNPPFNTSEASNNHIIPANAAVSDAVKGAQIGDQVRFKGYLSDYEITENGSLVGQRHTSTVRTDSGNGACEVVYVTDFELLQKGNSVMRFLHVATLAGALAGLALWIFFALREE